MLKKGDSGSLVGMLQQQLLDLGMQLPRYGADGVLGDETLSAAHNYLQTIQSPALDADFTTITDAERTVIDAMWQARQRTNHSLPSMWVDARNHPLANPQNTKTRRWNQIDAVCLHQTACVLGESVPRWHSIPIHFGITRRGQILFLNDLTYNLPHANGFNTRSVGLELDGSYAGIEGDKKTWWKSGNLLEPQTPTPELIESARKAIMWIEKEIARNGGKLKYVLAHRQSSMQRVSDPGSKIWKEVGVWCQDVLGLSDGGEGFTQGGKPIPEVWDTKRLARY